MSTGFLYDGQNAIVQAAGRAALALVQRTIGNLLTAPAGALAIAQDLPLLAAVAPDDAKGYAAALWALLTDYVSAIILGVGAVAISDPGAPPGYQSSSRLPALASDPSYGLSALAQLGANYNPASATGQVAANFWTLMGLVSGSATAALVTLYAQTEFSSLADADRARSQIRDLIVAQIEISAGNDTLVQSWRSALAAIVTDLTTRGKALPDVAIFKTASPMPAIELAQRLYQDGSRAAELVQRNSMPHPLFAPLDVEYLSP